MISDKMLDFIKENYQGKEKIYVIIRDEKNNVLHRFTSGFNAYELLGCLLETQMDIMAQMRGESKPTIETFKTVLLPQEAKE